MDDSLYDLLTLIANWLGPVVTVLGFIFIWVQLKNQRRSLESQTSWQVYGLGSQVLAMFVQFPELRPYFHGGQIQLPDEEPMRSRVLAAIEVFCDHLENIVARRDDMDAGTYEVWESYMRKLHKRSPVLRDFLDQEADRYSHDFLRLIRAVDS